jgi:hypothetical protein
MSFRNAYGIYQAIEQLLKASDAPLTCVDLYDSQDIRRFASDANRVSDYLGHMYRRGLLKREAAPNKPGVMARYAYKWKDAKLGAPTNRKVQPRLQLAPPPIEGTARTVLLKPNVVITEDGSVITIELPQLTLTIKTK